MDLSRRNFIVGGMALTALSPLAMANLNFSDKKGRLLLHLSCNPEKCKSPHQLKIFDLDNNSSSFVPINIEAHSFSQHPKFKNLIMGIGKWKKDLGLFNISSKRTTGNVTLSSDFEEFGGHGSFNKDGSLFYASAIRYKIKTYPRNAPGKGFIKVYKTNNLKLVDEFESFGLEPHESTFLNDNKTLVVINSGARSDLFKKNGKEDYHQSSISFINVENKKLVHQIPLEVGKYYLSHLSKLPGGDIIAAGYEVFNKEKKYPWAVKITQNAKIKRIKNFTKDFEGYLISTRTNNKSNYFINTLPQSNLVFLGNHKEEKILKTLKINNYPSGVSATLNDKYFVINTQSGIFLLKDFLYVN